MRSYDVYFTFYNYKTDIDYRVNVVQQPWYRVLISCLYHWYDMHISLVPGFRKFERWLAARQFKKNGFPVLTISDKQDVRCHFLSKKDKQIIATFAIDRATYIRLGGPESTPERNT